MDQQDELVLSRRLTSLGPATAARRIDVELPSSRAAASPDAAPQRTPLSDGGRVREQRAVSAWRPVEEQRFLDDLASIGRDPIKSTPRWWPKL